MPTSGRVKSRGILLFLSLLCFLPEVSCGGPDYTAVVVDAETGEPIEGAVYLAVWFASVSNEKPWFEGASTRIAKYSEGTTGVEGKVDVPMFWVKGPLGKERTLIVYKPGYVIWNSEKIFPTREERTDFLSGIRKVKLEKWREDLSYGDHSVFLTSITRGRLNENSYAEGAQLLKKTYREYEEELYRSERLNAGRIKQ